MISKQLTKLSYPILTKRSIYYLRHKWSGCLFCKSLTKATIYEWHFKSFYTVMGYDIDIFQNPYNVVMDRTLISRYKIDYEYDTVYFDFDDKF